MMETKKYVFTVGDPMPMESVNELYYRFNASPLYDEMGILRKLSIPTNRGDVTLLLLQNLTPNIGTQLYGIYGIDISNKSNRDIEDPRLEDICTVGANVLCVAIETKPNKIERQIRNSNIDISLNTTDIFTPQRLADILHLKYTDIISPDKTVFVVTAYAANISKYLVIKFIKSRYGEEVQTDRISPAYINIDDNLKDRKDFVNTENYIKTDDIILTSAKRVINETFSRNSYPLFSGGQNETIEEVKFTFVD